jgi:hypothetical protein
VIYDVYAHENDHTTSGDATVVARFGDDGPEYLSGTPIVRVSIDGVQANLGPYESR